MRGGFAGRGGSSSDGVGKRGAGFWRRVGYFMLGYVGSSAPHLQGRGLLVALLPAGGS